MRLLSLVSSSVRWKEYYRLTQEIHQTHHRNCLVINSISHVKTCGSLREINTVQMPVIVAIYHSPSESILFMTQAYHGVSLQKIHYRCLLFPSSLSHPPPKWPPSPPPPSIHLSCTMWSTAITTAPAHPRLL